MSLRPEQIEMLKRLVQRPLSVIDFKKHEELRMVQKMVRMGYVRDYGHMLGESGQVKRVPVSLRIWGITDPGRAVLEQQALAENKGTIGQSQLGLTLLQKPTLIIKPVTRRTHTRILEKRKGLPVSITINEEPKGKPPERKATAAPKGPLASPDLLQRR